MGTPLLARRACTAIAASILLSALPAHSARWLVVSTANAPGQNDTQWRTDFTGINPSSVDATVAVTLLPPGGDNSALDIKTDVLLPARGQKSVENVLQSLFTRSGSGALLLDSASTGLVLTTRTYNQQPDRQYGMLLPAIPESEILQANETGHIIFVADSTRYRTNIIYANASAQAGTITTTLFDTANKQIGTVTKDVLPYGQGQFNAFSATGAPSTTAARAEVTGTVAFAAVATIIDADTGDPFAVFARRASTASADLLVPAVVHAPGDKQSQFRSDVRAFNPSNEEATVVLYFYPRGDSSLAPESRGLIIPAKGLAALDDILLTKFQKDNAAGSIRFNSTKPLLVMSSTYNEAPEGTSGQDLPAIPVDQLINAGDTARLSSLLGGGFRTNLLLVNLSATELTLQLTMKNSSGAELAQKTTKLKAQSMDQINKLITDFFGLPAETNGFLEITTLSGSRGSELQADDVKYWATATVIENTSNDPYQVTPAIERKPIPGGGDCATFKLPRQGLKITYNVTSPSGGGQTTTTYVSVSETHTEAQSVSPGPFGPVDSTSILDYDLVDTPYKGFLLLKRVEIRTQVPFLGSMTIVTTFSPNLLAGPGREWCTGLKWETPSVTQTIVTTPPGNTTTLQTPAFTGEVIAASEQITVAAGTFTVAHSRIPVSTTDGIAVAEVWTSHEHGVAVKQVTALPKGGTEMVDLIKLE
jgi:hypothetical protein